MLTENNPMELTSIKFVSGHCRITVRFPHQLYTSQIADLPHNLLTMLPDLRRHRCQNRSGLSFVEEVLDTELGHAFEHTVLAVLERHGVCTRGETTWNWNRDPLGTYHITITTRHRVLTKQCILVAQAIFTNALHGPVLDLRLPLGKPLPNRPPRLQFGRQPDSPQLVFAAD